MEKPSIDILDLLVSLLADQEGIEITYEKEKARNTANGLLWPSGNSFRRRGLILRCGSS